MTFIYTLTNAGVTNTDPAGTDLVSLGDDNIRNFKSALWERVNSHFVDVNADPWVTKSPISGGMHQSVIPVSDNLYTLGTAALRFSQIWGTLNTPAQGNITSLGTLTSLVIANNLSIGATLSNPAAWGTFAQITNASSGAWSLRTTGTARQIDISLQSDNNFRIYDAIAGVDRLAISATVATFSVGIAGTLNTAAQPNITSLGTQVSVINSTAPAMLTGSGRGTNYQINVNSANTGATATLGIESSAGGQLIVGSAAYSTTLHTSAATSLHLGTNNNVRMTIDSAGNVVFTGTVTASNFVGPTTLDANNLTGTTLNAGVIHSSLQDVGTLTSLTVSGTSTFGASTNKVIINRVSDSTTYGAISFNGVMTNNGLMGFQGRSNGTEGLYICVIAGSSFSFVVGGSVVSTISSTGLYTGNVTGNLTGTVLTAAQGNITSLGTLTSLTVSGVAASTTGFKVQSAGSDTVAVGPYFELINAGSTAGWIQQQSASNHLDFWYYNGSAWSTLGRFATGGQFLVGTTSITGVAAGGIHAAGNSVFDGTIAFSGTDAVLVGQNAATARQYLNFVNTGGNAIFGVDSSAGGGLVAGSAAYSVGVGSNNATALNLFTNNAIRLSIASGGAVTANGAWTFNSTVSGITTLTATTLTGTLSTAAQTNVTSLGVLTSLAISGTGTSSLTLNRTEAAALRGYINIQRASTSFVWLGLDASDQFVIGDSTNANANMTMTNAGAATFRAGVTATLFTGPLTGNVTGNLTGTILTAAQANITSLGTLTALAVSGDITMSSAVSRIIPGATSQSLRNNANNADNLILTDAGAATFRSTVGGITTLTATTVVAALTGNVTGNLTGTVLTAAQTSITSLGTLTGLNVNGTLDNGLRHNKVGTTTAGVTTSAVTIQAISANGNKVIVFGDSAGTDQFIDEVYCTSGGITPPPKTSTNILGAPTVRTYSVVAGNLKLAMTSGTYTIKTALFDIV